MARWEPDARGRLARVALDLYAERGFEQTTVGDIAERAGVTERTFFRYFADKREVLFDGSTMLRDALVDAIASAPASLGPIEVVGHAFGQAADTLQERREHAVRRAAVVAANTSLQERELLKMASLAEAAATALRARGVEASVATLAAEAGAAAFRIAFDSWVADPHPTDLHAAVLAVLGDLRAVVAGT